MERNFVLTVKIVINDESSKNKLDYDEIEGIVEEYLAKMEAETDISYDQNTFKLKSI